MRVKSKIRHSDGGIWVGATWNHCDGRISIEDVEAQSLPADWKRSTSVTYWDGFEYIDASAGWLVGIPNSNHLMTNWMELSPGELAHTENGKWLFSTETRRRIKNWLRARVLTTELRSSNRGDEKMSDVWYNNTPNVSVHDVQEAGGRRPKRTPKKFRPDPKWPDPPPPGSDLKKKPDRRTLWHNGIRAKKTEQLRRTSHTVDQWKPPSSH